MEDAQQRALTDDELRGLRAVVDYSWAAEQRDFEDQDEDGRQNHIFTSLVLLDALLRDLPRPVTGATPTTAPGTAIPPRPARGEHCNISISNVE